MTKFPNLTPTYTNSVPVCKGEFIRFSAGNDGQMPVSNEQASLEWFVSGGELIASSNTWADVRFCDFPLGSSIKVRYKNSCGAGQWLTVSVFEDTNTLNCSSTLCDGGNGDGGGSEGGGGSGGGEDEDPVLDPGCGGFICLDGGGQLNAFPVPTDDELTLELQYTEDELNDLDSVDMDPYDYQIDIINVANPGAERAQHRMRGAVERMNIRTLRAGVYQLVLTGNGKTYRKNFIKR